MAKKKSKKLIVWDVFENRDSDGITFDIITPRKRIKTKRVKRRLKKYG